MDKAGTANQFIYADDLKIFKEISSEEDAESLQEDLYKLYNDPILAPKTSSGQMCSDAVHDEREEH